ncbi:MAG: MFS transporter [Alphaproteobacteria bacterium]|nr:MFS transporter [Alphaproteobacteria bacterium]
MTLARPHLSIAVILLATIVLGSITGYSWTLFSLQLEQAQVPTQWIGYAGTAQLAAIVLITNLLPRFLYKSNLFHLHLLASAAGILAYIGLSMVGNAMLLHIPLRLLLGCGMSGTYILYEYWLNSSVNDTHRGKVMALYCTCVVIGMSAGPMLVPLLQDNAQYLYVLGMILFAITACCVFSVRNHRPKIHEAPPSASPWGIIFLSPTVAVIALMFGITESSYWSFMTIYGLRNGLTVENAALLLSLISMGGMAMQLPMGYLADKLSPRFTVLLATGVGAAGGMVLPYLISTPDISLWLYMFLWGGTMTTIYTCAIILLGHEHKAANLANATLAFQMMYGTGNIFGPIITANSIETIGTSAVPWVMGLACSITFVFTAWRSIKRKHQ